jgi:ferric-dicitrate binding protein FerR (iron transport regulator)
VGDIVRTSEGASLNMMLIPGVLVQLPEKSEINLEELTLTKDGNETAGGMLDRRASVRLNHGAIVALFSQSARKRTNFRITAAQTRLRPDADCLFSVWTDGTMTRVTCGRGDVNFSVEQQPPVKIDAGYFSEWPSTSKEPKVATADPVAQSDVKKALDVELELLDEAAGWQNRHTF